MARRRKEKYWLDRRPGSPIWYTFWFDPGTRQTKRVSHGTEDVREAETAHAEFVIKNGKLNHVQPSHMPLGTMLARYYHEHASKIPSHVAANQALFLWNEFWTTSLVSELKIERQEQFIRWLKERGYKNAYVSRVLSVGRAALNRAWKRQEIASAPFIIDLRDRSDAKEPYRLSMDEMATLLSVAAGRHPRMFVFCMIALNTLARPQAVLDLSPFQVDLESRLIDLNPKGRKQTKKHRPTVPVTDTLLPFVSVRNVSRFVNHHGRPFATSIKTSFRRLIADAGLANEITPYSLRHTMATELRRRGVPVWELQGHMGHLTGGITETYAKFGPDYLSQGSRAIDAYFTDLGALFANGAPWSNVNLACQERANTPTRDLGLADNSLNFKSEMVGGTWIEHVTPTMST